jgi:hypothetical protein
MTYFLLARNTASASLPPARICCISDFFIRPYLEKSIISIKKAAELTRNKYQLSYILLESKYTKSQFLNMDEQ